VNTEHVRSKSQLLAGVLLGRVERIAERSAARMQELLPSYARVPRHDVSPIVLANTRNVLEAIREPDADHSRRLDDYRAMGETHARQGITSAEMLHAWRIDLEVVREEAYVVAEELGIGPDGLLEFVEATLRWGDAGARTSAAAHHEAEIRELGQLAGEHAALRRIATLVARRTPPEEVFAGVVEEIGRLLRVDLVSMGRYDPDGMLTFVAASGVAGEHFPVGSRQMLRDRNLGAIVFETGRSVRVDNYASSASGPIGVPARKAGINSSLATPIIVEGRVWGVIAVCSIQEQPLPPDIGARLASFTELVATAIANVRVAGRDGTAGRGTGVATAGRDDGRARSSRREIFAKVAEEVGSSWGRMLRRYGATSQTVMPRSSGAGGSWGTHSLPVAG
jgi:hypothetical protein